MAAIGAVGVDAGDRRERYRVVRKVPDPNEDRCRGLAQNPAIPERAPRVAHARVNERGFLPRRYGRSGVRNHRDDGDLFASDAQ